MQDNINRVVKLVTEAENAAALKDIEPFIRITEKLKGDFRTNLSRAVKVETGRLIQMGQNKEQDGKITMNVFWRGLLHQFCQS